MRDLIWTLIAIWVLFHLSRAFGFFKTSKHYRKSQTPIQPHPTKTSPKKHADSLGEYVDFEEIKD